MFQKNDPYTYHNTCFLEYGSAVRIGQIYREYQVVHFDDIQMLSGCAETGTLNCGTRKYVLTCTQRVMIYNQGGTILNPQTDVTSYVDYPALINTKMALLPDDGVTLEIVNSSPTTINTQVQCSSAAGSSTGQTDSSSSSSTVGSSMAQTNSYSASVGYMEGQGLNCSVSTDRSTTMGYDRSSTSGSENATSSGSDSSQSSDMSIKDWGGYSLFNPITSSPEWTFGQEYPWDAIRCRKTDNVANPDNTGQVRMVLPTAMQVRLYDGVSLFPPSHLSMFGINFVMKAQWLITVPNGSSDEISMNHIVNYFSASHRISDDQSQVEVYLDKTPTVLSVTGPAEGYQTIDLGILGLSPIGSNEPTALVGFLPGKFTVTPTTATSVAQPTPFKVFSAANNLRITDITTYPEGCTAEAGFSASQTELTATLAGNCTSLTMRLLFKVIDITTNYTLLLKHWKSGQSGVVLTITINGDTANALTKYVDADEAEGGEGNVLAIALRNLSVADVDYHDYLALGLNSIDITITPVKGTASCVYQMRAISVEAG